LPLVNFTKIPSALWITWLLVIIIPSLSIINPDPRDWVFLFCGLPPLSKSLNKSSNGCPGGNWNGNGFWGLVSITRVAEIFTTEGINFSTKSANESGASFEFKFVTNKILQNIINKNFLKLYSIPIHQNI
jgi:hypothetical protein